VAADVQRLWKENPDAPGPIPAELVTTSASGLDPDLSPEATRWQVARVAKARGRPAADVQALVDAAVRGRAFGFLGEPTVNVLMLNLALDRRFGIPGAGR
jgi:K+-transporting ATPase ATPase C chain